MKLKIKDLQSSVVHEISAQGAVMGREKARCDIALRGGSVSKRHARIFFDNGSWLLEDLNSSNGTFINNQRISGAVMLSDGAVFSLAQMAFEVVAIEDGGHGSDTQTSLDPRDEPSIRPTMPELSEPDYAQPPPQQQPVPQQPMPQPQQPMAAEFSQGGTGSMPGGGGSMPGGGGSMPGAEPSMSGAEGPPAITVGYFMVAVPKAIAYYLAAVPVLLFNPPGFVRKGIQEQKFHAMGKAELAANAIPAYGFSAIWGALCTSLAMLFHGQVGAAITAIIPSGLISLAIGIVVAVVLGLIFHPVMRFVIEKIFKGQTDAKSRSNYAMMFFTVSILTAVPGGLAALLAAIPIPFIVLLAPLIQLVATALTLFVMYSWFVFWQVAKWARIVIIVLGALAVLGTAGGFVSGLIHQISILGSGSSGGVAGVDSAAIAEAQEKAEAYAKKWGGKDPSKLTDDEREEMQKEAEDLAKLQAAAAAAASAAAKDDDDDDKKDDDDDKKDDDDDGKDDDDDDDGKKDDDDDDDKKKDDDDDKKKDDDDDDKKKDDDDGLEIGDDQDKDDDKEPAKPVKDKPRDSGKNLAENVEDFEGYIAKYKKVTTSIQENPAWLADGKIRGDYKALLKKVYEIETDKKYKPKKKQDPWDRKIQLLQRQYDIYKSTSKVVEKLHRRMFES